MQRITICMGYFKYFWKTLHLKNGFKRGNRNIPLLKSHSAKLQQAVWRCKKGVIEKEHQCLKLNCPCQHVTDAGQSKCHVERNQALEHARRPQESTFIPECNEDGTFAQVCVSYHLSLLPFSLIFHTSPLIWTIVFTQSMKFSFSNMLVHSNKCSYNIEMYLYLQMLVLHVQVQCHTLTGYCWCVTTDGKPVSGSSVHNRRPVCSGT